MELNHHGLKIELEDEWWDEAGMVDFVAPRPAYRVQPDEFSSVYNVLIEEVRPVDRELSAGIFNDDSESGLSAKERVLKILRGFRSDDEIPPVEVVRLPSSDPYQYKLTHGVHRFYCSLAAGFTHVPAVDGFDWATLDQ